MSGQLGVPPRARLWAVAACMILVGGSCAHRGDLTRPGTQDNFGVEMARMNLWREAMFRFRRSVEIDPSNPMAHNNLAVAYEANGDFESARKEYLEALRLDRSNQYIQKNYSRFVEFLSRNKKRQVKDVKSASTPASDAPAAANSGVASTPAAVLPPIETEPSRPAPQPAPPPPTPAPPTPTPPHGDIQ